MQKIVIDKITFYIIIDKTGKNPCQNKELNKGK